MSVLGYVSGNRRDVTEKLLKHYLRGSFELNMKIGVLNHPVFFN